MKNNDSYNTLGILGGLGPMATVYFYEMLTEHTMASCDQDHINMIISSRATTPDRTSFILGESTNNPLPTMIQEAERLVSAGADVIVLPCNTAHYFYDELSRMAGVEIINIIKETVKFCVSKDFKKVGILATEGTVKSGAYEKVCHELGVKTAYPSEESQKIINEIIYDEIKKGQAPSFDKFYKVSKELVDQGCQTLILGCTELSLLKKMGNLDKLYTDSLEVLAYVTILKCGKTAIGFDF